MIDPIEDSTLGLSSRQILQKHRFLQPSWLQPLGVERRLNNYREVTSQFLRERSAKELSLCNSMYRNDKLSKSPHDNKRYKLDIESLTRCGKRSTFLPKDYISEKAAIMSRRLSTSDMTLNVNKSDD